ncbi:MAG: Terminase-like family protein [Planctomycetes bacterium ADurb.Bin126]|nr:MAG: Terminase-like family protein [Planctomycetes bacterium ADurb.Bin126]
MMSKPRTRCQPAPDRAERSSAKGEPSRPDLRPLCRMLRTHFDLVLPDKSFTPGHSTPLRFVADAITNSHQDMAAWACRSGLKTLSASVIAACEFSRTDGLEARVLSGSQAQAGTLYEYWKRWCTTALSERRPLLRRTRTEVGGGRMEIVAASQAAVRGPKVHRLFEDELDEIDPEIDRAAVGMLASSPGRPARTVYTSTWHRSGGLMGKLIDNRPANGVKLHKWNVWEVIERCPPERHDNGAGCRDCPLGKPCLAKSRERHGDPDRLLGIAAEAEGLLAIDDAIKAFSKLDIDTWRAEYECARPTARGLVYAAFDPQVHALPRAGETLTVYRAIDWGVATFVCLWLGEDKQGNVTVLDTYQAENATLGRHAAYIHGHRLSDVAATYCDPAGRNRNDQTGLSAIEAFAQAGIPCTYTLAPEAREVRNGIQLVRAALRPAAGPPTLFYVDHGGNRPFVQAMLNYRNRRVNGVYIDEPQDPQEHEHIPDALRYFYVNRRRSSAIGVVRLGMS